MQKLGSGFEYYLVVIDIFVSLVVWVTKFLLIIEFS